MQYIPYFFYFLAGLSLLVSSIGIAFIGLGISFAGMALFEKYKNQRYGCGEHHA